MVNTEVQNSRPQVLKELIDINSAIIEVMKPELLRSLLEGMDPADLAAVEATFAIASLCYAYGGRESDKEWVALYSKASQQWLARYPTSGPPDNGNIL